MSSFGSVVCIAGLVAVLVLVCACVSESVPTEEVRAHTDNIGAGVLHATATKEAPTATVVQATKTVAVSPNSTASALVTLPGSEEKVPTPVPTSVQEEREMTPTGSISQGVQGLVDLALAHLAQRLGVDVDQIELVEIKEMVWPDGSLGCPQPGMRYIQVPQDGLLIRLGVGERVYDYHSGGGRDPFLCEQTFKAPKTTPLDLDDFAPPPGSENE